jgi:hypothetical protein
VKHLIKKLTIKVILTVLICAVISLVLAAVMPVFGNDVALGQLENDDVSFIAMEAWNRVQNGVELVQLGIITLCGVSCSIDAYKFIKTIKGENE